MKDGDEGGPESNQGSESGTLVVDDARLRALIERVNEGDPRASAELFEHYIPDLHRVAQSQMRGQSQQHTLQATALVNEAFLRIVKAQNRTFESHRHFLLTVARAMRHVLIDHDRRRGRLKRTAPVAKLVPMAQLESIPAREQEDSFTVNALNDAIERLEKRDLDMARAVELRFFGGHGPAETARLLKMKQRSFDRRWKATLDWLRKVIDVV